MSFDRLGRFAVRRRWWIVAAWAVLVLSALPLAPRAAGALSAGGFILDDLESARAKQVLQQELGVEPSAFVLAYTSDTLRAGTPGWLAAVRAATKDVAAVPHVTRILSHALAPRQVGADGHTAYDIVFLDLPPDDSPDAIPAVAAALHEVPGLRVRIGGGPAFYGDVQAVTEQDLRRSELISLPLAALTLLFVFGSVIAAGVPLAVGGAAVLVALASIFLVASVMPMSIFVLNLATLLGLGLGVDYSLLMTSRFREELARHEGPDRVAEAVRVTMATAGRAVFFSGLTVLLGLLGLVLFEFMILRSVGIAGAIVVGLAVLAATTLLPAILAIVGTRVDALAVRRVNAEPGHRRAVGEARPPGDGPPGRRPRPDAHPAAGPRPAVPPRAIQLPRRDDPPVVGPVARGVRRPGPRVRRGRVRADRDRRPHARSRDGPGERRRALRLVAPPRRGPARVPGGELRGRRPAPDARPVPAAVRLARRTRRTGSSR